MPSTGSGERDGDALLALFPSAAVLREVQEAVKKLLLRCLMNVRSASSSDGLDVVGLLKVVEALI